MYTWRNSNALRYPGGQAHAELLLLHEPRRYKLPQSGEQLNNPLGEDGMFSGFRGFFVAVSLK